MPTDKSSVFNSKNATSAISVDYGLDIPCETQLLPKKYSSKYAREIDIKSDAVNSEKIIVQSEEIKSQDTVLPDQKRQLMPQPKFLKNSSDIFNSAIIASAISAAYELDILSELQLYGTIDISAFCHDRDLHEASVSGIISTLCCFDICAITDNPYTFKQGSLFPDVYSNKGFFLWLIRGNGTMMQNLASIARNENRTSNFIKRDGKYIATASYEQGSRCVEPYFEKLLNELPFNRVVDFGCGSAERLINLAKKHSSVSGIGIDINSDAVNLARMTVQAEGLESQVTVIQDDIRQLAPRPEFLDVDTLFCFFCGHDFWPWENCLPIMRNIRTRFPNVKRFLLCDTYLSGVVPSSDVPIFTLGFELIHSVMGQYVPSLEEWMNLFEKSGWKCVKQQDVGVAHSKIFDLRPE